MTVTIEEYLSNPAYEHCEYVDGELLELNLGRIHIPELPRSAVESWTNTWIEIQSALSTRNCFAA